MSGRFLALAAGDLSFVGRSNEFDWLRAQRHEAESGLPRVVLVGGEPGVGKSRLFREFLGECDTLGWQTLWSRCSDRSSETAPFVAALLARAERAGIEPAATAASNLALRTAGVSSALAARRPLCLVVDDLHSADDGTQELFADYVRCIADLARESRSRILVLVSHHATLPGDALQARLERLRREPITRSATLAGMQEVEVHELVRQATGANCDPPLLDALVATTHGNPFYVLEVLNHLSRQGQLEQRAGNVATASPISTLRLPANASSSVAARLESLSPATLAVLRWAALLGDPFQVVQLAAVAGEAEIIDPIDLAVEQGVLHDQGPTFAFAHGLIRDALLGQMGPMRRRACHAEIAARLRARFGEDSVHLDAIAGHLLASGTPLAASADGLLLHRAGNQALDSYRWGRGRQYLEAALGCAPYRATLTPSQAGRLVCDLARGAAMAGDRVAARTHYFEAITLLREAREFDEWGRAILEWERTFTNMSEPIPDTAPYDEFRDALGDRPSPARSKLLTQWAEALWLQRDSGDLAAAERAVATIAGVEDAYTRSYAFGTRGLARMRRLDCEGSLADFERSQREAEPTAHPPYIGHGASRRAMPLLLMGRIDEAVTAAESALALAQRGNDWSHSALGLAMRHALAGLRGDWEATERLRSSASMMLTRSRYPQAAFFLHASVARERWLQRDLDAALGAAEAWTDLAMRSAGRPFVLLLRALAGERGLVAEELHQRPIRISRGGADFNVLGSVGLHLELASALGEPGLVEPAYEAIAPFAANGVVFSPGPTLLLERLLGTGARLVCNLQTARVHLQRAQEQAEAAKAPTELGLVHLERARLLLDEHAPADQVEAALSAAAALFHRYRMDCPMEQARAVAVAAGVDPAHSTALADSSELTPLDRELVAEYATGADIETIAARLLLLPNTVEQRLFRLKEHLRIDSPQAAVDAKVQDKTAATPVARVSKVLRDLTPRELEVLRLIALGRTNQQIADTLVVTIHTAQSHVKSILSKTECANRTEAARLAAQSGLL